MTEQEQIMQEIQACNYERGMILGRLNGIQQTLDRLEPLIQSHESQLQRQVGYIGLVGILASMIGAIIEFIASRFFK